LISKVGFVWDDPQTFNRLIEDCGITCEHVNPQLLASPFYRGKFVALFIPTGFANPDYSRLAPALRASSPRIRRFAEKGGKVVVFGAGEENEDAYDWLPFSLKYHHEYNACSLDIRESGNDTSIIEGFDTEEMECDGWFTDHDCEVLVATRSGKDVMLRKKLGNGFFLITSIHEYPSRAFLKHMCTGEREILF